MKNLAKRLVVIIVIFIALSISFIIILMNKTNVPNDKVVNVYYVEYKDNTTQLVPLSKTLNEDELPLDVAIEDLISGPTQEEQDKGYYSEIPIGSRVIKLEKSPDKVIININKRFISGGGSESMIMRLKQLVYTVVEADPIRKIYLYIDGEPLESMSGEGLEVVQPLSKENFSS